jgi:hypothetical protein
MSLLFYFLTKTNHMKKQVKFVVTALSLMLVSFTTKAQFKKAEKFAEGTVSYLKATGTDGQYLLNPAAGYFLTDKFAVGVSGEFSKNPTTKVNGVGAFGRCYVLSVGSKFHVYSQLSLSSTTTKAGNNETSVKNANVGLGANYFVSKNLALSTSLASLIDYTDVGSTSTFSIGFTGVNNQLNAPKFGILYRF